MEWERLTNMKLCTLALVGVILIFIGFGVGNLHICECGLGVCLASDAFYFLREYFLSHQK